MFICEHCHGATTKLVIHEHGLWCPTCHAHGRESGRSAAVIDDTIIGGFVQTNFGHEPETFYSKSEMARRAKELGLEPMVRWSGPNDRHVGRWV